MTSTTASGNRAPSPVGPVVVLLAPLVAGVVLLAIGRPIAGSIVLATGFVRAHIAAFPRAEARTQRATASVLHGFGRSLAHGLLWLLWAVVVAPVFAIRRLLRRPDLRDRPIGWQAHGADLPGSARPRRGPRRWPAVAFAVAIAVLALIVVQSPRWHAADPTRGAPADALADQPDHAELQADEGTAFAAIVPDAERGWRLPDQLQTEHVNIEDGHRVTRAATSGGPVVWLFGGSAAWGTNQRDPHTIASELVAIAEDAGTPLTVVNWGVSGYTAVQEHEAFAAALAAHPAPDVAVFYDGFNDLEVGAGALLSGLPSGSQVVAPLPALQGDRVFATGPGEPVPTPDAADVRRSVLAAYETSREASLRLGREAGVTVVHAWQPSALTTPGTDPLLEGLGYDPATVATLRRLHTSMAASLPPSIVDMSRALEDRPDVFTDQVHTDEEGARLVASDLYDHIRPALEGFDR